MVLAEMFRSWWEVPTLPRGRLNSTFLQIPATRAARIRGTPIAPTALADVATWRKRYEPDDPRSNARSGHSRIPGWCCRLRGHGRRSGGQSLARTRRDSRGRLPVLCGAQGCHGGALVQKAAAAASVASVPLLGDGGEGSTTHRP